MWEERSGSALVIDGKQQLRGIFTERDVVRLLAKGKDANCPLVKAMTRNPVTITANSGAVDALLNMADGGFSHVPVAEEVTIKGWFHAAISRVWNSRNSIGRMGSRREELAERSDPCRR